MRIILILILSFFASFIVQAQEENIDNWELKKAKNGIKIYTRLIENSKFKEYKSICVVDATPEKLIKILLNVDAYPDWMAYVKTSELLKENGKSEFYVYSEVNVPWPFENRDQVTRSVLKRDKNTNIDSLEITIIPDFLPKNDGIVRMPSGNGLWIFTPLENGKTEIYHRFGGDPGGKIPSWVVNMFLVDGPFKTMTGLQQIAVE